MIGNLLTEQFNKAINNITTAKTATSSTAAKSTGISPSLAQKAVDIGNNLVKGVLGLSLPSSSLNAVVKAAEPAMKSASKAASTGGRSMSAEPVANPLATGYDMQAVADALNRVIKNQEATAAKQAEQRAAQQASVNQIISPEHFNTLLTQALANYNPLIDANKASMTEEANETARLIDIDAEQRGIYNSGMATVNQKQNLEKLNNAIQAMRAQIQAQAVGDVKDIQNQGLQAIGMQGDWTTADSSNTLNALKTLIGANTDMAGLGLEKYKTDAQLNQNQQKIYQDQQKIDQDYVISIGNIALNREQLDQRANEFVKEMEFNEQKRLDSIDQFAKSLGLQKDQLSLSHKADMANSVLRAKELELSTRRFNSEQDLIAYQLDREELEDQAGAYTMLSTLMAQGAPIDDIKAALAPYKTLYPKLYDELINSATTELGKKNNNKSTEDAGHTNANYYNPKTGEITPVWVDQWGNKHLSTPPPGYVSNGDGTYRPAPDPTPTPPSPTPKVTPKSK